MLPGFAEDLCFSSNFFKVNFSEKSRITSSYYLNVRRLFIEKKYYLRSSHDSPDRALKDVCKELGIHCSDPQQTLYATHSIHGNRSLKTLLGKDTVAKAYERFKEEARGHGAQVQVTKPSTKITPAHGVAQQIAAIKPGSLAPVGLAGDPAGPSAGAAVQEGTLEQCWAEVKRLRAQVADLKEQVGTLSVANSREHGRCQPIQESGGKCSARPDTAKPLQPVEKRSSERMAASGNHAGKAASGSHAGRAAGVAAPTAQEANIARPLIETPPAAAVASYSSAVPRVSGLTQMIGALDAPSDLLESVPGNARHGPGPSIGGTTRRSSSHKRVPPGESGTGSKMREYELGNRSTTPSWLRRAPKDAYAFTLSS